jgi:hypothetical protein
VNGLVSKLLGRLSVKHWKASAYYPQANSLVEKTNGILCNILGKVVLDKRRAWDEHLNEALWAYRTAYKVTSGFIPFKLAYGFEAVIPIELEVPSLRTAIEHGLDENGSLEAWLIQLQGLDEFCRAALQKNEVMQACRKAARDKLGKLKVFSEGDLVMVIDDWLMKQKGRKFIPRWKGPYQVVEKFDNGTYMLATLEGDLMNRYVNGSKLKDYFLRAWLGGSDRSHMCSDIELGGDVMPIIFTTTSCQEKRIYEEWLCQGTWQMASTGLVERDGTNNQLW